ncbi:MAG TPA: phosphopantetheine-binding protein [Rhodocyclaceae bacterium]|jgi:acyl carrier protein|nr:phosphopantetheine-binding protein [Rhodocyclaceae bacterium]
MTPKEFILAELTRKGRISGDTDTDTLDYRKAGYVDSIGLVKFILTLEREFNIEFSEDEVGSEAFRTVGSLAHMIEAKMKGSS